MSRELRLGNQVCFSIYSASNAIVRFYRPVLDDFDLTYPQYIVMMSLWEKDGVTLRELCQSTYLDAGTMTPIVKRLEAKAFLLRQSDPHDERAKRVVLTEQGRKLEESIAEKIEQLYKQFEGKEEELSRIKALCESVRHWVSGAD